MNNPITEYHNTTQSQIKFCMQCSHFAKYIFQFRSIVVFPSLFTAIAIFLNLWSDNFEFVLQHFNKRVIGIAVIEQIDIMARISQFYKALLFGVLIFFAMNFLLNIGRDKIKGSIIELKYIKYISIAGLFLLLYALFGINVSSSINILIVVLIFFVLVIVSRELLKTKILNSENDYLWFLIYAFSLSFLFCFVFQKFVIGEFAIVLAVVLPILLGLLWLSGIKEMSVIFFKLRYIILLPFIYVFFQELFVILNQYGVAFLNPIYTSLIFLFLLVPAGIRINIKKSSYKFLNKYYIPLFAGGLILFTYYSVYVTLQNELFEIANSSNSIMNIFIYGKMPVAEFLGTHLLADLFSPVLYTILSPYDADFSYISYNFIYQVFYLFLCFFLVLRITRNKYIALVSVLFFPYWVNVFWSVSSFPVLLTPLVIYYTYKNPIFRNWLLFFVFSVFALAWKPDTGFISIYGLLAGVILILVLRYKEIKKLDILYSFLMVYGLLGFILVSFELFFNIPVREGVGKTLEFYSSSPQARGLPQLAYNYDRIFTIHHIIYPILVTISGVFALSKLRKTRANNLLLIITIIIFSIFYLVNFQRGLTRHCFAEGGDSFITSFALVIIALTVYLFKTSRIKKHILFFIVLSGLIIFFKFPKEPINLNLYEAFTTKLQSNYVVSKKEKISRAIIDNEFYEREIGEISRFLSLIPDGETFYDFSNTPALYYTSGKEMPVYFIHALAITNENLQLKEIQSLKRYKIPYVIFSHVPANWWDNTDGIPNTVRFYKISEYLYQNYSPYKIIGNYAVWKENSYSCKLAADFPDDTVSSKLKIYNFRKLAYIWANYDKAIISAKEVDGTTFKQDVNSLIIPRTINKSKGNYLSVSILNSSKQQGQGIVDYFSLNEHLGQFAFDILGNEDKENYIIRISTQYNWYANQVDSISVRLENDMQIADIKLLLGD